MTFEEILDQAIACPTARAGDVPDAPAPVPAGRGTAGGAEGRLLFAHPQAHDEAERGLVWTGDPSPAPPASAPQRPRVGATRPHASLSGGEDPDLRSALEGERKQVTVLFADLEGSTELIRDLDPEAAETFSTQPCST